MSYSHSALEEAQLGRQAISSVVAAINSSTAVTVNSTALAEGVYTINATVDMWFRQGGSSVTAAKETNNSRFLPFGSEFDFFVRGSSSAYISAIAVSSSGHCVIGSNRE